MKLIVGARPPELVELINDKGLNFLHYQIRSLSKDKIPRGDRAQPNNKQAQPPQKSQTATGISTRGSQN